MSKNGPPALPENQKRPSTLTRPSKLFVEPTTRCNLRCGMCVKQTADCRIPEGDLRLSTFERLLPAMGHLDTLILTGVGEPTMHPDLPRLIELAREHLPGAGKVGFQTNGRLLDQDLAEAVVHAGCDRICLSVDAPSAELFRTVRPGGELHDIENAFRILGKAHAETCGSRLEIGIEFVLMQENMRHLPEVIAWAAEKGATFAVVSHLLPYGQAHADKTAWSPNSDASAAFFEMFRQSVWKEDDVDIRNYPNVLWKYNRTAEEDRVILAVNRMKAEARKRDLPLHMANLVSEVAEDTAELADIFQQAGAAAARKGLALTLPALRPKFERRCDFVEEGSAFVSWDGNVHPCYFLWHRYSCFLNGERKQVAPKVFGNVIDTDLLKIWNSPAYARFRGEVLGYDYPHCGNCNVSPCDLVTEANFEHDCYLTEVPCCDCPWCLGLSNCLR